MNLSVGSFTLLREADNNVSLKREPVPKAGDRYYLAFDIVYGNMDVVNKYLELRELAAVYPKQIMILDIICFEHIILSFSKLIEWTGTGKKDKIAMREVTLSGIEDHKIDIGRIVDRKRYITDNKMSGVDKMMKLFMDNEMRRIIKNMRKEMKR